MWSSLFFIKVDFFLPQTEQFDKSIDLFCLVFLIFEFSFSVYFLQLTQQVSIVTYNQAMFFLTINFVVVGFIMLSDLNSNPNNLVEILLISLILDGCLILYCFLSFYFVVSISVAVSIFISFYCKLIVMKIQVNL